MQVLGIEIKWTVPNVLSLVRMLLVPLFMVLYLLEYDVWAFAVLFISGVTDMLDGMIARRCNQITDFGKLLDPLSDKLTQVAVVICLTTRYPALLYLAIICLVKEVLQGIGGIILLRRRSAVRGSVWFGKAATVVFYVCMLIVVLWNDNLPPVVLWSTVGLAAASMLAAFIGYMRLFILILTAERKPRAVAIPTGESEKG